MNEPLQLNLLHPTPDPSSGKEQVYTSPPDDVIDQFANGICRRIAVANGETSAEAETVQGFTTFVKTIIKTRVNQLNQGAAYYANQKRS